MKQFLKVPESKEITIKLPKEFQLNDLVEVTVNHKSNLNYDDRIELLTKAVEFNNFLDELEDVSNDFSEIDSESWF